MNLVPATRTPRCAGNAGQGRQRVGMHGSMRRVVVRSVETATIEAPPVAPSVAFLGVKDGEFTVEGRLESNAPPEFMYDVLVDYERLADTFHNISDTEVYRLPDRLHIKQICSWSFLIFSGQFSLLLKVDEDAAQRKLTFDLVKSSFMRSFLGTWQVTAVPGGGCVVEHRQQVRPVLAPPAAVGEYMEPIFVRQVSRILEDLQQEVDRRLLAAR